MTKADESDLSMTSWLDKITLYRLEVPLRTPYRLAFGVIDHFDTIVVEMIAADGRIGLGEATVLTGYTDEKIDDCWQVAKTFASDVVGLSREAALDAIHRLGVKFPFTATALGTAIEMLDRSAYLALASPAKIPLVGLLHAKDDEHIEAEISQLIDSGYRTIKVKVGFDVAADLALVRRVQSVLDGRGCIRLDANQGYSEEDGVRFVQALDPAGIELFEQPCKAGDWDAQVAVARVSPVAMMLDESIYGTADIERAASLNAASYIKVKLMKLVTLDRLVAALERIKALGMTAVLGNGVACDLSCWMEGAVAARHIDNAGEMNGFLKASSPLLANTVDYRQGALCIASGYSPRLDREAMARYGQDSVECWPRRSAISVSSAS